MKIGLVLSGGGTRGVFHIGVLKAIQELKIRPVIVSGASAGALVGSMYCEGIDLETIFNESKSMKWYHFLGAHLPVNGLTDLKVIEQMLQQYIPHNSFENLKIPLKIVATNIHTGHEVLFSSGPLIKPVIASCAVPILFEPVEIDNIKYLDGGIVMNLPVSPIRNECDMIIASNLIPLDYMEPNSLKGMTNILTRVLEISIHQNIKIQKKLADVVVESNEICKYKRYDLSNPDALFDLGYSTALNFLHNFIN